MLDPCGVLSGASNLSDHSRVSAAGSAKAVPPASSHTHTHRKNGRKYGLIRQPRLVSAKKMAQRYGLIRHPPLFRPKKWPEVRFNPSPPPLFRPKKWPEERFNPSPPPCFGRKNGRKYGLIRQPPPPYFGRKNGRNYDLIRHPPLVSAEKMAESTI